MKLKLFKLITIILYFTIMVQGEHIGGLLIIFLLLGLLDKSALLIISIICWIGIGGIVFSTIKPSKKRDRLMLPICLILMMIPVVKIFSIYRYTFLITTGLFLLVASYTLYQIFRSTSSSGK